MSHLANPWILARLALGLLASLLAVAACAGAFGVFAYYRDDAAPDERTLRLERQSELIATTLGLAFALELGAALLTVLVSDRLAGSIRGAMCAYGVLGSSPWGPRALASSALAAAGCAAWLATRRVDARLRRGSLVRTLAGLALVVGALVVTDFAVTTRYLFALDLDVVASCCSVFVDTRGAGASAMAGDAHARMRELAVGAAAGVLAGLTAVALARRASLGRALAAGGAGLVAGYAALRAVVDVVAPYAYESPHHRCAYCLLHREVGLAGPALLAALATAALLAVGLLAVAPLVRRDGARDAALAVLARIGRASAVAWAVVLVTGLYPIARYGLGAGTLQLFR